MTRFKSKRLISKIFQISIIYLFVHTFVSAQGQVSIRRRVPTDNCERLPPPGNSAATHDEENNQGQNEANPAEVIQSILVDGMRKLPLQTHDKSAIMILGNTGSGKTTMSLTINGDHNRIRAVKTYKDSLVIVDDDDKIGAPSTTSKTLVPEYIVNPNNSQAFYDCPGFDDNRGPEMDIAAMYFVKAITEHIERAKFLFTVTHSSIRIGNDRNDFDLLAKHATRFLRRIDNTNQSIALIITKVNSFDSLSGSYLSDDHLLDEAGEFLLSYHKRLTNRLKTLTEAGGINPEIPEVRRKILFVESLLEQDEQGYFTRIWFLRSPTQCGPYSQLPYAAEVRQKIIDMYTNNMVYVNVTPSDFGFTLKDATMLKIKDTFIPAVKRAIIESTNETLHELKSDYFQEFRGKFNATGAEKVAAVLELEQHFDRLRQSRKSITDYRKAAAEKVLEIARALGNRYVDQGFVTQTQLREKCLAFFQGLEDAVDGVVAQSDTKTFAGLREIFQIFLRDITQFYSDVTLDLLRGALPETRSMIDDTSKNVILAMYEGYMIWFNQTLPNDPLVALTSFTREYNNLEYFYQALNKSSGSAVASTGLKYLHSKVFPNVNYPSISQGIANIKLLEGQLSKLVNLTGATSLQATFSPVDIVMLFRAMRTHVLNVVQNILIPEQQQKIKEAAERVTFNFLDNYSKHFLFQMNSTDSLVTLAAIENFEIDHTRIETFWANNMDTAATTVSGVMEQIFGQLQTIYQEVENQPEQQQRPDFQVLIDLEIYLGDLRRSVEITDVGENRIIETVILHLSHEFIAFRNKVHHLIREERITNLVNAMETSTQEILTTLLGEYFATMGSNLKEGDTKGAAALKLLQKDCTHMKQLEDGHIRKNSNFSVRGQINEILSSKENIPQKESYLRELESNEQSIAFFQNVVRNKKRAKPTDGSLVGLSAVVLNFLRQFQQSCAAARRGESSAVPNGVKRIEAQVKQALRNIHDSYMYQFTNVQETEKLDAYKNFLEDFKKLKKFQRDIDDHSGGVIEQLKELQDILWSGTRKSKAPDIQPQCDTIQKVQNQLQSYLQIGDESNDVKIVVAFGPQFVKEVFQPFQDQRSTILNEIEDLTVPDILARMHSAGVSSIRNFMQMYGKDFNEKFVAAGNSTDSVIAAMKTDVGSILDAFSMSSLGGTVPPEAEPTGSISISTELENVFSSTDVYKNTAESDESLAILKSLELQLDSVKKSFKMTKLDQRKLHVGRTLLSTFQVQLAAFRDKIVTTDTMKKESEAAERREREWQEQRRREREEYEARQKRMEEEWKHRTDELVQMRKEHHDNQIKMQEQLRLEREEARKREEIQQQNFLKQLEAIKKALTPPPPPPPPPRRPWWKRIFG